MTIRKIPKRAPSVSRPYMPGYDMMFRKGRKHLSWKWAIDRFAKSHNYYLATGRPDGRPHVMPIWGIWLDNAFYFSTGRRSRKSRNLTASPNCVICPEDASEAVILEGVAKEVSHSSLPRQFTRSYKGKYDWTMKESKDPFYRVEPRVVFGIVENGSANPTRWRFGG